MQDSDPVKDSGCEAKATDPWIKAYMTAALETDRDQMSLRIAEASEAIEERLKSPFDTNSKEYLAIVNARKAIETWRAEKRRERTQPENTADRNSFVRGDMARGEERNHGVPSSINPSTHSR